MTDHVQLDLVTPDQRVLSEGVEMVVIPGELGDFGVMAYHAPFVSMIRAGVMEVHISDTKRMKYFVSGGYANVANNICTVLAESLVPVDALNREAIQQEIAAFKEDLAVAEGDVKRTGIERHLATAETKLAVCQANI